jgi:hypothetical protein
VKPYLEKNPSQKRAGGVAQGIGPEFKPQYQKKKKCSCFIFGFYFCFVLSFDNTGI